MARRLAEREFIARGLKARDDARKSGRYVPAEKVVSRLEGMLARAKRGSPKK